MLKFTPIILAVLYGLLMYALSARRLRASLDANSSELDEPELVALCRRLAIAAGAPRIVVHVYDVDPLNGLAAPDGRIFITRGFLERYRRGGVTAAELASVVAHELGHTALGHARRRMIEFSLRTALRTTLVMMISRFVPFIGAMIVDFLASLVTARLSRADEYEADAYAAALMTRSGIGTAAQKSLLAKLRRMTGAVDAAPVWTTSHPEPEDRIAAIEALEAAWADPSEVDQIFPGNPGKPPEEN